MNVYLSKLAKTSVVLSVAVMLNACGGGGDVAGDRTEFSVSPDEFTWKVAADSSGGCTRANGAQTVVTIVGGVPPFRIQNSLPTHVRVDRTEATGKDPVFKVTSLGGCVDPATILVLDYQSRTTTFEFTVEVEDAE